MTPRVSVGVPTYNRAAGLRRTIACLRAQTFGDFEVVISDNASPDPEVARIGESIAGEDARFRYVRQPENRGPGPNFLFALAAARAPLFMWAADDDVLAPRFIEQGVAALERAPNAHAWMCTIANINVHDKVIRRYPAFDRFTSSRRKKSDLARFLMEPECLGKANLFYSLFDRAALQRCMDHMGFADTWGHDMATIYAFLARNDLVASSDVLLHKRSDTDQDDISIADPRVGIFPRSAAREYIGALMRAAAGTPYVALTWLVMHWRWLGAVVTKRGPP
jgi:glycosyltransferase involved in cell wall biosynthesis